MPRYETPRLAANFLALANRRSRGSRSVLYGAAMVVCLSGWSSSLQAQIQSSAGSGMQSRTSGTSAFSGSQSQSQSSGGSFGGSGQTMSSAGQVTGSEFYVQGSQASTSFIGASTQNSNTGFIGANAATGQGQTGMNGRSNRTGQTGLGQLGTGRQGTQLGTGQFGGQLGNQFGNQFGGQFGMNQNGNRNRTNQFGNQQNGQFGRMGGTTSSYRPRLALGFTPPAADIQTATQSLQIQVSRINQLPVFSAEGNDVELQAQGRKVVLTGTVPSEDQRKLFERLVKLEPGVSEIDNQIQVVAVAQ